MSQINYYNYIFCHTFLKRKTTILFVASNQSKCASLKQIAAQTDKRLHFIDL